jgi:AraC-like DNA-binding protein
VSLLQARESLARVAYVALPPDQVFISFPSDQKSPLIWRGIALQPDEMMLHSSGEHLHQRTNGPSAWGLIALSPAALAAYSQAENGCGLPLPQLGQIIRPPPRDRKLLLRIQRQAARLAETRPAIVGHPEVVRAMELDLAGLIVRCLTDGVVRAEPWSTRLAADIMQRLERELAKRAKPSPTPAGLAATLGVPARTLHKICVAFLGVTPRRYLQLRQLASTRAAILRADPRTVKIAELARMAGFNQADRFSDLYKAAYGEAPSATLRRAGES